MQADDGFGDVRLDNLLRVRGRVVWSTENFIYTETCFRGLSPPTCTSYQQ